MSVPISGQGVPEIRMSVGCRLKAWYNFTEGASFERFFSGVVGGQKEVYTLTEVRVSLGLFALCLFEGACSHLGCSSRWRPS